MLCQRNGTKHIVKDIKLTTTKNVSTDAFPPANICSICCMSCCWAVFVPAAGVGVGVVAGPGPEGGGFSGVTFTPEGSGAPGIPEAMPPGIRLERDKLHLIGKVQILPHCLYRLWGLSTNLHNWNKTNPFNKHMCSNLEEAAFT